MLAGQVALAVASAGLVVVADQATKAAVQRLSLEHSAHATAIQIKVVRSQNGGLGRLTVPRPVAITSGLVVITLALAAIAIIGPMPRATVLGLGVAVGGAAGNVVDLLVRGYVVDFVSIGRWPVFNLADVALCVGVGITFLGLW